MRRSSFALLLLSLALALPASATTDPALLPRAVAERGAELLGEDMNLLLIRLSETKDRNARLALDYQLAYTLHALHRELQYVQKGARDQQLSVSCGVFAALPKAVSAHVGGPDPSHLCEGVAFDRRAEIELGLSIKAPGWKVLSWVR